MIYREGGEEFSSYQNGLWENSSFVYNTRQYNNIISSIDHTKPEIKQKPCNIDLLTKRIIAVSNHLRFV